MKKVIFLTTAFLLIFTSGVFAGKVLKQAKTPRGNFYTVESEKVEKNKHAVVVDGKLQQTYTIAGKTYVPVSAFKSTYDKKKWTYSVKTNTNTTAKRVGNILYEYHYLNNLLDFQSNLVFGFHAEKNSIDLNDSRLTKYVENFNIIINTYNENISKDNYLKSQGFNQEDINKYHEILSYVGDAIDNQKLAIDYLDSYAQTNSEAQLQLAYDYNSKALDLILYGGDLLTEYIEKYNIELKK